MTEQECLEKMIAPGQVRPSKPYRGGVIQINVCNACDKSCFNCTQGSNYAGPKTIMSPEHFEQAVRSLGFPGKDAYFGVVGVFGGNPALSPHFNDYCEILKRLVPFEQRGLWCNHPRGKGRIMRETFNPGYSNLNVHLNAEAAAEFRRDWPEAGIVGERSDSRHSPVFVAMKDVGLSDSQIYQLASNCDINQHWSAMIGVFRGELRAWFCEVAGAQALLHQHEPDYPDTGLDPTREFHKNGDEWTDLQGEDAPTGAWWKLPMIAFRDQVRKHCFDCGVPLRGYGELAQSEDVSAAEQVSATHKFRPKHKDRAMQVVTELTQLETGKISSTIRYLQNSKV